MARIKTATAGQNINTGPIARFQAPIDEEARGIQSFGADLAGASSNAASAAKETASTTRQIETLTRRQDLARKAIADRQKRQNEALEIDTKYNQLRTDWAKRYIDYTKDPQENQVDLAVEEYDKYTSDILSGSSSNDVRDNLKLKAADYRISFVNKVHNLQTGTRASNFATAFNQALINAEDAIFADKSLGELEAQRETMNNIVIGAKDTGRINDKETELKLRDKINQLSVAWGEAVVGVNPEMVERVINETKIFEGVPIHQRTVLLNKAKSAKSANTEIDKLALSQAATADVRNNLRTGSGSSLDMSAYADAFGDTAAQKMQRKIDNAKQLYVINQEMLGQSEETIAAIVRANEPQLDPKSVTYHEDDDFYHDVQKMASNARQSKENDPYVYFALNPAIEPFVEAAGEAETQEANKVAMDMILEAQKADKSIDPFDYAVMPNESAKGFIERFNKLVAIGSEADGAGVREAIISYMDTFEDHLPIANQQLNTQPDGDNVTPKLNPLLWHINNPTLFESVVNAIRKDPVEQFKKMPEPGQKKDFLEDAALDGNFNNYMLSVLSTHNDVHGERIVKGVRDTWTAFSRDFVINGGSIDDASASFFSNYTFGNLNGFPYYRPITYTDDTGQAQIMSPEQIELSNGYLTWYHRRLDPSTIDPSSILNETRFFSSDELTEDVTDAMEHNVFWAPAEDEAGVYLYTKGSHLGSPRQVFDKQGEPIRVDFKDTMVPIPSVPFNWSPRDKSDIPMTDDNWIDHLRRALERASD